MLNVALRAAAPAAAFGVTLTSAVPSEASPSVIWIVKSSVGDTFAEMPVLCLVVTVIVFDAVPSAAVQVSEAGETLRI